MKSPLPSPFFRLFFLLLACPLTSGATALTSGVNQANQSFGFSVAIEGDRALVGATTVGSTPQLGYVYLFDPVNPAAALMTPTDSFSSSDQVHADRFSSSMSLSGDMAAVGASSATTNVGGYYLFRNLDTPDSLEQIRLDLSGSPTNKLGTAISISGNTVVTGVSSIAGKVNGSGAAYLYRDVDTAIGPAITEDLRLVASDGANGDRFGTAVSMDGNTALVSADLATGLVADAGAAYLFRNLNTAPAGVDREQDVKLTASEGASGERYGTAISLSGGIALVGAYEAKGADSLTQTGAAYFYRNLDTTGAPEVTEQAKLLASDGAVGHQFARAVSVSGTTAIVTARQKNDGASTGVGAAYLYLSLDTASGNTFEDLRILASDRGSNHQFGTAVDLNGDDFIISALGHTSSRGRAYVGSVSSMTTLDEGDANRTISQLSFVSNRDWIIGAETSNNTVTLSAADSATVSATGKAVYIGRFSGSNDNTLHLDGTLTANGIQIGSPDGNHGNTLSLAETVTLELGFVRLAGGGNRIEIAGDDYSGIGNLLLYFDTATLQGWDGTEWVAITAGNYDGFITSSFDDGITTITSVDAIPEPGSLVLALLGGLGLYRIARRRDRATAQT